MVGNILVIPRTTRCRIDPIRVAAIILRHYSLAIEARGGKKKRILIVEDNADCRELLRLIITRQLGCEVVEAATGLAAVDQASATHPDLILMDLGLPGMSGVEAPERIKANPAIKDIPIVINTAFNATDLTRRALAAGVCRDFTTNLSS